MARTARRKKPTRKAKKPAALAPRSKKAEPVGAGGRVLLVHPRNSGPRVTEDTALTLGAVFACVRVVAESLAGLPWKVFKTRADGGLDVQDAHPVSWLLHTQPNPEIPAFQWRETLIAHALTWGNGYAEVERDMAGRPVWLWLITPDRVTPFRSRDTGRIVYEVANPYGEPTYLDAEDMFHLRGLGFDGLVGYSIIQMAARSIAAGIALDQATTDFFANDSTPGGVLKMSGRLSDPARKNLIESWERRHQGQNNRRRVAILEEGLEWQNTGLPPEDTKLIEQRQFTPADVCRWFRVPPHKIGDLTRATFSNIEHQSIEFVNDTLRPWAERLETEADIKLFGRTNRGSLTTIIDLDELKRGDTAAQAAFVSEMITWGIFSINDGLRYLGRNGIGPDGDKRFMQQNMTLVEKIGADPPKPPPAPALTDEVPPNDTPPGGGDEDESETDALANGRLRVALAPVFEDACRRLLHAEAERAREGIKGGAARLETWYEKIRPKQAGLVRNQLRPAVASMALARGAAPDRLEPVLGDYADRHLEGFKDRLVQAVSDPNAVAAWEELAAKMATELFERVDAELEVKKCEP